MLIRFPRPLCAEYVIDLGDRTQPNAIQVEIIIVKLKGKVAHRRLSRKQTGPVFMRTTATNQPIRCYAIRIIAITHLFTGV